MEPSPKCAKITDVFSFNNLPDELFEIILSWISTEKEFYSYSLVCSKFHAILKGGLRQNPLDFTNPLWRRIYENRLFHQMADGFEPQLIALEDVEKWETYFKNRFMLKTYYGVDFPEDLFQFYEFCKEHKKLLDEYDDLNFDFSLDGPTDLLESPEDFLKSRFTPNVHYRYYWDPPEFFTVMTGRYDCKHIGYYFHKDDALPRLFEMYKGNEVSYTGADTLFQYTKNRCEELVEMYGEDEPEARKEDVKTLQKIAQLLNENCYAQKPTVRLNPRARSSRVLCGRRFPFGTFLTNTQSKLLHSRQKKREAMELFVKGDYEKLDDAVVLFCARNFWWGKPEEREMMRKGLEYVYTKTGAVHHLNTLKLHLKIRKTRRGLEFFFSNCFFLGVCILESPRGTYYFAEIMEPNFDEMDQVKSLKVLRYELKGKRRKNPKEEEEEEEEEYHDILHNHLQSRPLQTNLEALDLSGCELGRGEQRTWNWREKRHDVTRSSTLKFNFAVLAAMQKLRALKLVNCCFSDEDFENVKLPDSLLEINLSMNGLERIPTCVLKARGLKEVNVEGCPGIKSIDSVNEKWEVLILGGSGTLKVNCDVPQTLKVVV